MASETTETVDYGNYSGTVSNYRITRSSPARSLPVK
jgi:hypothetical protein